MIRVSSAEILTSFESCRRKGVWTSKWEKHRVHPLQMIQRAVVNSLTQDDRPDFGELAGETVSQLCLDRGLDIAKASNYYESGVNHASIADLITTAIRKPGEKAWRIPRPPNILWEPSASLDSSGAMLRRFLPVSTWNPERESHEARSWFCLGEVCQFKMPMQLVVAVVGQMNAGRRHSYWSRALLHPQRSSLRFRKRTRGSIEGFKESWIPIFREDHDEITRNEWLTAMHADEVLTESLFVVNIPVPSEDIIKSVRLMAARNLETIKDSWLLPPRQLSTCDGPLSPCPFRSCCWSEPTEGPEAGGFDPAEPRPARVQA